MEKFNDPTPKDLTYIYVFEVIEIKCIKSKCLIQVKQDIFAIWDLKYLHLIMKKITVK